MISPLSAGPEPVPAAPDGAYEALMQFLYRAPVGLAQVAPDGQIEMINPMAAQLLMPLSANGNLDNLFVTLEIVAPALRHASRWMSYRHVSARYFRSACSSSTRRG